MTHLPPLRAEEFPKRFYLDDPDAWKNVEAYDKMTRLRRRLELEYSMSTLTRVVRKPRHFIILDIFETKQYDWNRSHARPPLIREDGEAEMVPELVEAGTLAEFMAGGR